jgi:hypothetical protein
LDDLDIFKNKLDNLFNWIIILNSYFILVKIEYNINAISIPIRI